MSYQFLLLWTRKVHYSSWSLTLSCANSLEFSFLLHLGLENPFFEMASCEQSLLWGFIWIELFPYAQCLTDKCSKISSTVASIAKILIAMESRTAFLFFLKIGHVPRFCSFKEEYRKQNKWKKNKSWPPKALRSAMQQLLHRDQEHTATTQHE